MKKYYLFAALAATALASCTNDDFVGDVAPADVQEGMAPIVFSSSQKAFTRADFIGADAAKKLNNKFVVFGYKGPATASDESKTVFDNYLVKYAENTANITESNSTNWEYVLANVDNNGTPDANGIISIPIPHAKSNGITQQTIKYWDYSVDQYDFFAWSTGSKTAVYTTTPTSGQVKVSKMAATPETTTGASPITYLKDAYTFEGAAADLAECYISDLVTVNKTGAAGVGEVTGYGNPVTLKFRQLGTKVRLGIYETIPGYSVKDVKFYTAANTALATDDSELQGTLFTTTDGAIRTAGTYTVKFPTVDNPSNDDNNQAHITFAAAASSGKTTLQNGTLNYTIAESGEKTEGAKFLGRTSNTATFAGDASKNFYEIFLPNEDGVNLNLRVNYTLESIDGSGEVIEVKGATAQVPSIYAKWLPGYAYTYLFKISDKTNGYTGVYDPANPDGNTTASNPAGLYPITFDAVVVNAEDGGAAQETITTVAAPSITTYQKGSTVVNDNEYKATTGDIYVTVNDGSKYEVVTGLTAGTSSVAGYYTKDASNNYIACAANAIAEDGKTYYKLLTPVLAEGVLVDLTDKATLYTVAAGTTEAQVVDALQMQDDDNETGTIKGRNGVVLTEAKDGSDNNLLSLTNSVEFGVDGNAISVGTNEAAKFTPSGNTTYAFVYTKQDAIAGNNKDKYQPLAFANFATGATKYRYGYQASTKSHSVSSQDYYDAQMGVAYFERSGSDPNYTYTSMTPFVGQTVNNLYLDENGTVASGYAVSGTKYYYTVDNGMTYKEAHNVSFGTALTDLFVKSGDSYNAATDTSDHLPANNTAYYYKDGTNYIYCVFLPQQTNGWYVLDKNTYEVATENAALSGQTYFDKYTQNDGVYYTKVIKVE